MQVRVLKKFKDKHTGNIHKVGEVFRASKERFAEIQSVDKNLVEEVKKESEEE